MSNICCLFDACTAINLIHIEDGDFILKSIESLDITVNETVFNEIRGNVFSRLKSETDIKFLSKKELEDIKKDIDLKVAFFRRRMNNNKELLKDVGKDYFENVKTITGYSKKTNGELCSTAHALYLSRYEKKLVYFYTDDYPAKKHFSPFFSFQQIGQIKDTVDLLIMLFWLNDKFTIHQLNNALSELRSQYSTEVTILTKRLQKYYEDKLNASFIKSNKEIIEKLKLLIQKLVAFDFNGIRQLENYFSEKTGAGGEIYQILKEHKTVFHLEFEIDKGDFLNKITVVR